MFQLIFAIQKFRTSQRLLKVISSLFTVHYLRTISCNFGIKDPARWQFWRKTQRPFCEYAFLISSSAFGPWPRPSDIKSKCKVLPLTSFTKRSNSAVGSEPEKIYEKSLSKSITKIYAEGIKQSGTAVFSTSQYLITQTWEYFYHYLDFWTDF